jgi:hypothetical protein
MELRGCQRLACGIETEGMRNYDETYGVFTSMVMVVA